MENHPLWEYPESDLRRGGIYRIVHIPTGREYIGKTWCFGIRWKEHCSGLRYKRHHTKLLERSWHAHGEQEFRFEIIEFADIYDEALLIQREQHYIDTRNPYYNSLRTAGAKPHLISRPIRKSLHPPQYMPQRSEGLLASQVIAKRRRSQTLRIVKRMTELGWGKELPDQPLTTSANTIARQTNMTTGIVYIVLQRMLLDEEITSPRSFENNENQLRREKTDVIILSALESLGWGKELPPESLGGLADRVAKISGLYISVARRGLDRLLRAHIISCPMLDAHMVIPHRTRITETRLLEAIDQKGWGTSLPDMSFKVVCQQLSDMTKLHPEVVSDGLKRLIAQDKIACINPSGSFGNDAKRLKTKERILAAMIQLGWNITLPAQSYNASAIAIISITHGDRGVTRDTLRQLVSNGEISGEDVIDGTPEGKQKGIHDQILAAMRLKQWGTVLPTQSIKMSALALASLTGQHPISVERFLKRMITLGLITYHPPPSGMAHYRASPKRIANAPPTQGTLF